MNYNEQRKKWAARRATIAKQYRGGKTVREIANAYDLTTERVRAILKREGVKLS